MKVLVKVFSYIEKAFSVCVALGFTGVSICVVAQILARYIPGMKAPWTDELGRLCFFYTVMFGAPLAFAHREYAYIDVFITKLKGRPRHIANALIYALVSATAGCVFANSGKFMKVGTKTLSVALGVKMQWFYGPIIMLFGFSAIGAACVAIYELYKAVKGEE